MKTLAMIAASLLVLCQAHAADVYKWTDSQGVTHFGDKPPQDRKVASTHLDVGGRPLTPDEQKDVDAQLAADRAAITARNDTTPAATGSRSPMASKSPSNENDCARQWRLFNESAHCLDTNHHFNADKASHPERYQSCMGMSVKPVVAPMCAEPVR